MADAITDSELRSVADRAAIRALIDRYFFGLDRRDPVALASIYHPDGVVRDGVRVDVASQAAMVHKVGRFEFSHHLTGSVGIDIDGDTATGDTYAVAFLCVAPDDDDQGDGRMIVRGLRYLDEYVRTDAGWRISKRNGPIPLWQYEVASLPPAIPAFVLAP